MTYDPTFFISIFSSSCLLLSEVLPFLPIKSNGFVEMIINIFKNNSKVRDVKENYGDKNKNSNSNSNNEVTDEKKLLNLIQKQDESIHELSNKLDTLIIVLKK